MSFRTVLSSSSVVIFIRLLSAWFEPGMATYIRRARARGLNLLFQSEVIVWDNIDLVIDPELLLRRSSEVGPATGCFIRSGVNFTDAIILESL